MSIWNYVMTAHKPTNVTHSCVGNFSGPQKLNLIVAKCNRIEIHLLTPQGLQPMLDVPIYGRIATLELFRPPGETQDLLFLATERYKFCVLQWNVETNEVITRAMGDVSDRIGRPADNGQIGIVDPDCRLIGLHLYDELFMVIPFDNTGHLKEAFNIRLDQELQVLDIQFLYGCSNPTIVVLYQDNKDARHVTTYVLGMKDKDFVEGPWSQNNLDNGADMLIPVPPPHCGVLIIGEETIVYCSASTFKAIPVRPSITRAYGRVDPDGSRYLLGDHNGLLHLLVITHDKEKVTGLKIELLGETSVASSISYLDNAVVFVGSSYGDSQLIKLNIQPDAKGSYVEVLERYVNLGPIVDFCVVDLERQEQGQVVTCSGAYKDGSLRIVRNGTGINEQASVELQGIKGMWSLRSRIDDPYNTFLVVSFINETRILAMNSEDELEETEIGFWSNSKTLFCHDAAYDQLVQVNSSGVRLINSHTKEVRNEWFATEGYSINVATANVTQVLLAMGGGQLVYLEIGDGVLTEVKRSELEYDISCLDINPIGDNQTRSQLAAVGMWTDISVRIFSLPDLNLITKEHLGGEIIPHSVLLCSFDGIAYLFCALGDGHLLNFELNTSNGELTDRKKVSLGTQPIILRTFSSKKTTHVLAASDRPTVIYSSNKKLLYSNVNLKDVSFMCPFNTAAFPDSLAIAKEGQLRIGTIDDTQQLHIRSIPLGDQTRTFAICSLKYNQAAADESETHFVSLLDDQTFDIISTYPLDQFECGCSISSSFSDDTDVYYCVGTAYVMPEENEPSKGRILVFAVEDGKLQLIAEKETKGAVYSLNAFNGKLLAAINQKIQQYKWMTREDGTHELQSECGHCRHILALYVQTRGDFIVVGDLMKSISLLIYKHDEGAIEGSNDEERGRLEVVGGYHLGEVVNRFRRGSLVMRLPDSDVDHIPTLIFHMSHSARNGLLLLKFGPLMLFAKIHQVAEEFYEEAQQEFYEIEEESDDIQLEHEAQQEFNRVEEHVVAVEPESPEPSKPHVQLITITDFIRLIIGLIVTSASSIALVYPINYWITLGAMVLYVILWALCVLSRDHDLMRQPHGMKLSIFFSYVASFTYIVTSLLYVGPNTILAYTCLALILFCLVQTARPIYDYGLVQYFLCLPLQTAISQYRYQFTFWYISLGLLLVLGIIFQVYS